MTDRISTPELAAAIGVTDHAVRAWLRGDFAPSATRLADVAAALGVPLADVVMAANGYPSKYEPPKSGVTS